MLIWDDGVVWWGCQGNRLQGAEIIYVLYACNDKELLLSYCGLTVLLIKCGDCSVLQTGINQKQHILLERHVTIKQGWNCDCIWPSFVSPDRRKQISNSLVCTVFRGVYVGMRLYENVINQHCFMLTCNHYEYTECKSQIEKKCSDRAQLYYGVLLESIEERESYITCPLIITGILRSLKHN